MIYCFCSTFHEIRASLKLAKPAQVEIKKATVEQGCFAAVDRNVEAMRGSVRTTEGDAEARPMNIGGGSGLFVCQAERRLNFVYSQTVTREPRPIKVSQ